MGSLSHFLSLSLPFCQYLTFSLSKSCSLSLSLFGVNGNAHLNNLLGLGLCARYFFKWRNNNSLSGSTRRLSAFQWFTIMKSSTESETLGLGIAVAPEKVLRSLKWFLFRRKKSFSLFFRRNRNRNKRSPRVKIMDKCFSFVWKSRLRCSSGCVILSYLYCLIKTDHYGGLHRTEVAYLLITSSPWFESQHSPKILRNKYWCCWG